MSQIPLFAGLKYQIEFSVEDGAFLQVQVARSVSGGAIVEIFSDDAESRLQAFLLCAATMRAIQHSEKDSRVRVKMIAWKEVFNGQVADEGEGDPPPPSMNDIPF